MKTSSAHKWADIRRRIASWLWAPFPATSWQASQRWGLDVEPTQPTPVHVPLIDGIAGGPPLSWPVGTYSAVRTGRLPHLHREPDMLPAPIAQDEWINSKPGREEMFADVADVPDDEEDGFAPTVLTERAKRNKQFSEAIEGLKGA